MNVSMIAPLVAGDGGAGSTAGSAGDNGEGFGLAVQDAAEQHGGKARAAGNDGRRRTDKNGDADKTADGKETVEAVDDGGAEPADVTDATSDVLGRILGLSLLTAGGRLPAAADAGGADPQGGDDAASNEPEERIVISTVADLAGAPADEQPKRVALRVTGMETHFEPVQGGPKLVDAKAASALPEAAAQAAASPIASDADTAASETIKTPFAEILQRLDAGLASRSRTGGNASSGDEKRQDGGQGDAQATATDRKSANRRADGAAEGSGATFRATAAERPDTVRATASAGGGQSTGQIINAQLAERIVGAFADQPSTAAEPGAASPNSSAQVLRLTAGGGALKTLSIQLEPQDLGRVDVSMRLVDGRLTVELAASEASTAATLAGDRHGLRKILEHAGFALDDAAITIVARDPGLAASAPTNAASGDTGSGGGQSTSQNNAFDQGRGGGRDADERSARDQRRFAREARGDENASSSGSRGGSVYL